MFRLLTGPFLHITLANFFFFMNFASFFLLPLHIRALGGNEVTVGAVMGTAGLASFLVLPAVALLIDRLGRRRFLMFGALCMTIASAGYLLTDRIAALFVLRALQGVSFAAAFTATTTFAAEFAPRERRAQALGIFGLSTLLTHAIAPALGEEIIHRGGFQTLFAISTLYTIAVLILGVRLPARPMAAVTAPGRQPSGLQRLQWVISATMLLVGMGFGSVMTFIPTYVRGEELGRVTFFFAAYTGSAMLTRVVGAGLSDSLGRRRVILPTLLVFGLSILVLALVRSIPGLVLAGLLFGAAQGISYPTMHALLVDLTRDPDLGRAQAIFNGAFNLGVTSSAFVFGMVAEHLGHRPMFALASLTPVAAWIVFYLFGRQPLAPAYADPHRSPAARPADG